ncbi:hypothetical protein A9Q86_14155 [Flavobacteriales bacterium 33_180_T64]|nr:hypothetical protein A9Q86_14155 [Flavobacteriales bacterium 33_180_T64]
MKQNYTPILLAFLLAFMSSYGQVTIHSESFEGAPNVGYTSTGVFSDGTDDYFDLIGDATDPTGVPAYSGIDGTKYWAGEDTQDGANPVGSGISTVGITSINISGYTSVNILGLFGAGSSGAYDDPEYIRIYSQIDSGGYTLVGAFEGTGGFNTTLNQDTTFDGTGDGTALTTALQQFSFAIGTTGNTLDLRIDVFMTAGNEAVAFDNIEVEGISSCTDAVDYANIQSPTASPQTITVGDTFNVYAQAYEAGVTEAAGAGAGIEAWIGYSSTNDNPSNAGWTWTAATFNVQSGNNDEFTAEIGSGLVTGTYYYATRFRLNSCGFVYGGTGGIWSSDSVQLVVDPDTADFCNVDFPKLGNITTGATHNVYAQVYEPGVTDAVGQGANILSWIGYNTTDNDPSIGAGWTWVAATYDSDSGNNDQYIADIGAVIGSAGTYYYASRFQLNGSTYTYGGIQSDNVGNFWDAVTNNSGILTVTDAPCSDLFISEYVEGSSNNKFIEIYNPTASSISLTGYDIQIYSNGSTSAGTTIALSGTVASYDVFVLENSSEGLGFASDQQSGSLTFNGDDAIALRNSSTIIDVVGEIGLDPGSQWTGTLCTQGTADGTLVRNSTVQSGDDDGGNTFDPDTEWSCYSSNDISNLGSHTSDCQGTSPEIQLVDNTATNQNCGYTIDYGNVASDGSTSDLTFDIENAGSADLDISSFGITGDYTIISPATPFTVTSGNTQTVTVRFTPSADGTRTGVLTINNNDSNEAACAVNLTGEGFTPAPEIDVERNTLASITNGNAANAGNNTIFATTVIGNTTAPKTYYVRNEGTANLTVSSITSSNNTEFNISTNPAPFTLLPTESIVFEIEFSPTTNGTRSSTITLNNNDSDENPYTFGVEGDGDCAASSLTITPTTGPENTIVTVTGTNFGGSTTATVNGLSATVSIISATEIEVTIPSGATTGSLEINDDLGCLSAELFTVIDELISSCEGSAGSTPTDIFISEITDHGTGSHSYVELFNGTGASVDLSDYEIRIHNNGAATATNTIPLTGTVINNDVFVVAFGSTDATTAHAAHGYDLSDNASGINEDDNIRLYNTATTTWIDLWGDTTGSVFTIASKDYTYRRKNTGIVAPSTTWDSNDWDSFTPVDYSDIGAYDFSTGTPPTITVQPNTPSTSCDLTASISITATEGFVGGNSLAYQWYFTAPGNTSWTAATNGATYSGATSATLNILNTLSLDGYQYYCEVREDTATCYTATNAVKLNVATTTWDGADWTNSTPPDINTIAVIDGDYDTSTHGSFSSCQLIVNSTYTLTINNNTFIEVENNLTVDGNILIETDGSFVQNNNSAIVDGAVLSDKTKIVVEKETAILNSPQEYTYWSSPVFGEVISDGLNESAVQRRFWYNGQNFRDSTYETSNDDTTSTGQDDIDDDANDWQYATAGSTMSTGVGYAATHAAIGYIGSARYKYTFEGPFNNGIYNIPIYRNDAETNDNNWNFIGNPYPSAIDADLFLAANGSVDQTVGATNGAIFFWSHNTAADGSTNGNEALNYSQSDYAIINGTGQTAGGDGVVPNRFIPSGQGFFVSMTNAATSTVVSGSIRTTDIIFNNSMRVTGNNAQFFRTSNVSAYNKIRLDLTSNNGIFNQILVGYVNGATNEDDGMYYDAHKNLSINANAILYSLIDTEIDKKYAIQGKAPNDLTLNEVISLGFYSVIEEPTIYTLAIAQLQGEFMTNNTVYLRDNLLNITHDLNANNYSFTSETGEFNSRFEIIFQPETLSVTENEITPNELSIIELGDGNVKFSIGNSLVIKHIEIIDVVGRTIYKLKGNNATEIYNLSRLSQSTYIARVTLSNGQVITKKAIKRN